MSEERPEAKARLSRRESPTAVELAVSPGTSLESILQSAELAAAVRQVRGRGGCNTCISGHPIFITEDYLEVVSVQLEQ